MTSSNHTPPFNEDDANRFKNKEAIDTIIPHLLRIVLDWGCRLQNNETLWAYLERKYESNQATLNQKWRGTDRKLLQTNDSRAFDVTLLKKLIPDVCEDFDLAGKKPLAERVTTFMNQLAGIRNDVAHNPTAGAISPKVLQKIKEIVPKLLDASAKLFTIDPQMKKDQIEHVNKMFEDLEEKTLNKKHKILKQIKKTFCSEGKKEIEKVVRAESNDFLPASKLQLVRRDVFHECKMTVVTEDLANPPTQKKEKTIQSGALLDQSGDSNIIILGEPGVGKSTLVRRLREDFVTKQRVIFRGVQKYELMIFMECRKNGLKTIPELIQWNFPESFRRIKADYIVEVLFMMKVLFIVDGIDESSNDSQQLLQSLIDKFGHCEGTRFIFASRPGATQYLEKELGRAGCSITVAKLQPLTTEHERIEFLERYQESMPGIDAHRLINAYKGLDETCKKHLIYPVHLALFCFLYQSAPDDVGKWRDELSIMHQILKYSKTLVLQRLEQKCLTNPDILASRIIKQACNMALSQIAQNKMTIQQETYEKLAEDLLGQTGVSHKAILSCLYVSHEESETYEYVHLAHAEFMAAKALFEKLKHNKTQSIGEIILEFVGSQRARLSTEEALRYGNTFKFIVMLMFEAGTEQQDLLKRTVEDICQYLTEGRIPFSYWAELCLACPCPTVVEAAARAAKTVAEKRSNPWWNADNPRYMRAATAMLPLHQPRALRVNTPASGAAPSDLEPFVKTVGEHFTGRLYLVFLHSYSNFTPVNTLITHLSASRCKLVEFWGCLEGGSDAWKVLRTSLQSALEVYRQVNIRISLLEPRRHDLSCLNKTSHTLDVRVKTTGPDCDRRRRPLPMSKTRPPRLVVHCTEDGEDEAARAAALVEDLAPEDKQYGTIVVQHWKGSDDQLTHLTATLAKAGLLTKGATTLQWIPAVTKRHGSCGVCQESSHRPGERCVQIDLAEVDPRDKNDRVVVDTEEQMTAVTGQLLDHPFPWVAVRTRHGQAAPPALGPLMEGIGACHKGTLDMDMQHSYRIFIPADHLLISLHSAQCPLVIFRGCLRGDSEQAWRALTAALLRAERAGMKQYLSLSLLEPRKHLLDQLEQTRHQLEIRIRLPLNPGDRSRRPLPVSTIRAPGLIVECSPPERVEQPAAAEQAAALIEDLAPKDMRYYFVLLQNWPGTDDALDELVKDLSAAGVTTDDVGSPRWNPSSFDSDGDCITCRESNHRPGKRCVQLRLP